MLFNNYKKLLLNTLLLYNFYLLNSKNTHICRPAYTPKCEML
jgi:hypothetical protein